MYIYINYLKGIKITKLESLASKCGSNVFYTTSVPIILISNSDNISELYLN